MELPFGQAVFTSVCLTIFLAIVFYFLIFSAKIFSMIWFVIFQIFFVKSFRKKLSVGDWVKYMSSADGNPWEYGRIEELNKISNIARILVPNSSVSKRSTGFINLKFLFPCSKRELRKYV